MAEDPSISVCICTCNGAERVGLVLEALAAQTDRSAGWEVLVVDNASRDDTGAVVQAAFAAHLPGRGRLVREERPGLMHARRRATDEARGATIVFLDDDNIPAPDAGMAVITLHDAALNVYDGVISRWRKIWEYPLERFRTVDVDTTAIHGELVVCTAPVTVQLETTAGARITVKHAIARTIGPDQPTVVLRPTSGLIDGGEHSVLEVSMQAATVVCDGTNWYHI